MAQRTFGPTRAAGVSLTEIEGEKTISPAALGWAGYAGVLEKGPVGELIEASNKSQFKKKCGSYIADSLLPDSANHYYDLAAGAGGLVLIRITDGNEAQSEATLYARNGDLRVPMGTIKSHNGGRWGGKKQNYTNDMATIGDLTETTLTTAVATFQTNQWVGGYIELSDVANSRYPITGNTSAGVITVAADQTMLTDHSGGADLRYYLVLENEEKAVSFTIEDGEENQNTEFSLSVFVDGDFVKKYPNLNTDPTHARYWVSIINNDTSNSEIEVIDLWTGAHTASVRPANYYGNTEAITETVLTSTISDFSINSPTGGNPTFVLGTTNNVMVEQSITITMTSVTDGTIASDKFGDLGGTITLGALYTPNNKYSPPFTVTAGATPLVIADTLVIQYKPFIINSLIDGSIYPDKVNAKLTKFRIVANDHVTITVAAGSDMTIDGAINDKFMIVSQTELSDGLDGIGDITDADYTQKAWDVTNSPFNRLVDRGFGIVKMGTPGITSTVVQKAGVTYASTKNHQYRYEAAANVLTEIAAITLVNDTLGRNDFAVMAFPSFGIVADPDGGADGKRKTVSMTGMIHGREARIAADYDGYHKAQAGIDATLPAVLDIPAGEAILDEEQLNPVGIATIKKKQGNFVIWGDRTLNTDPTWKWKHQRELMSYYEHVLQENFDWLIFKINDRSSESIALASLQSYFRPEWVKRALRGDTFDEAAIIKIDSENNTDATRAAGDMHAEILLRLADTVERFKIRIGKQGVFSSAG